MRLARELLLGVGFCLLAALLLSWPGAGPRAELREVLFTPLVLLIATALGRLAAPPAGLQAGRGYAPALAVAAASGAVALTLGAWLWPLPSWPLPERDVSYEALLLTLQTPTSLIAVLLAALISAAPLAPLLLIRRLSRELEAQVAAGALGGALALAPLAYDMRDLRVLLFGVAAFAILGAGSYLQDRVAPERAWGLHDAETIWARALGVLTALLVVAPIYVFTWPAVLTLLDDSMTGRPKELVEQSLLAVRDANARYLQVHKRYAPGLVDLDGLEPVVKTTVVGGYVLRYGCDEDGKTWSLAADAMLEEDGWTHYLIGSEVPRLRRSYYPLRQPRGD